MQPNQNFTDSHRAKGLCTWHKSSILTLLFSLPVPVASPPRLPNTESEAQRLSKVAPQTHLQNYDIIETTKLD